MYKIDLIIDALDANDKYVPLCNYFKEHISDFDEFLDNDSIRFHYHVFESRIEEFIEAAKKYSDAETHDALVMYMSNNVNKNAMFRELIWAFECIYYAVSGFMHDWDMHNNFMNFLRMSDIARG